MPDRPVPSAVLDTNTLLDWLVFRDPPARELGRRIEAGTLVWLATPSMRREFEQVLGRAALAQWQPDAARCADAWGRHARLADEPPAGALRCADLDDQVFIDHALHTRCRWLLTRDRALLKLGRRAAAWGVTVTTPAAWFHTQLSAHTAATQTT